MLCFEITIKFYQVSCAGEIAEVVKSLPWEKIKFVVS
jgi:hypothetical protein